MSTAVIAIPKENESTIVQEIPLDRIRPSEANPRGSIDAASLAELAASIELHGVLQPILVRPAPTFGYEIICGERRWRASLKAKRETVPARVVNLSNSEALEYATVENLLRADIHPLEEAASYEKLLAMNQYVANPMSLEAKLVINGIDKETDGSSAALRVRSVLDYAQDIKAATLIMNGAKDDRTEPSQARELAAAINKHGGSARVIIYPNYGHHISVKVRNEVVDPFIERVLNGK